MEFRDGVYEDDLSLDLTERLKVAEQLAGFEFEITSGYRDGDTRCHGRRKAVDIACGDSNTRYGILRALFKAGFQRIGIYNKHVHADTCIDEMPQGVAWLGVSR